MKNIEDPETQCVVTELMFAAGTDEPDALDDCGGTSADTFSTGLEEENDGYERSIDVQMSQLHARVRELRSMSIT